MVTLHGGDLGGQQVDRGDWQLGQVKAFQGLNYRLDKDDFAVFIGVAQ